MTHSSFYVFLGPGNVDPASCSQLRQACLPHGEPGPSARHCRRAGHHRSALTCLTSAALGLGAEPTSQSWHGLGGQTLHPSVNSYLGPSLPPASASDTVRETGKMKSMTGGQEGGVWMDPGWPHSLVTFTCPPPSQKGPLACLVVSVKCPLIFWAKQPLHYCFSISLSDPVTLTPPEGNLDRLGPWLLSRSPQKPRSGDSPEIHPCPHDQSPERAIFKMLELVFSEDNFHPWLDGWFIRVTVSLAEDEGAVPNVVGILRQETC